MRQKHLSRNNQKELEALLEEFVNIIYLDLRCIDGIINPKVHCDVYVYVS